MPARRKGKERRDAKLEMRCEPKLKSGVLAVGGGDQTVALEALLREALLPRARVCLRDGHIASRAVRGFCSRCANELPE